MHFITLTTLASAALVGVSAIAVPSRHIHMARQDKPSTYAEGYLEPYTTYHERYLAIGCENKHNTSFFDACCHPMLATETLEKNRAPECNPANQAATGDDEDCDTDDDQNDDDEDCDEEPTSASAQLTTTSASAQPTTTSVVAAAAADPATSTSATPTSTSVQTTATPSSSSSSSSTHKTSSTHKATPTSSSASSSSTATSGGGLLSGDATFFYQGGVAGACGTVHSDSDFVAALQTELYGDLGARSSNCGRKIELTNTKNGKTVSVVVADACPTCLQKDDLDLSFAAFTSIATVEEGEVPITWRFVS